MTNLPTKITSFYVSAFRRSVATPTGRRLWLVLLLKVTILLVLFKILFFPNRLAQYSTDGERAEAVRTALTAPTSKHKP
ncbi:MAG: DUF4492 domain-containing protein [Muribaculaceae bacterium]|nr:DUF4492 domain-containing protein [Muribaculaceae bacterium]